MYGRNVALTLAIAVFAVLFILYMWKQNSPTVDLAAITPTTTPETMPIETAAATSSVLIAVLDTARTSSGISRGCDKVVMVNEQIPSTTAPLNAALNTLFSMTLPSVEGGLNFIARTSTTLKFEKATIVNGTANIYLTGSLSSLAGVCDDPRAEIQIEETAKQFPSVQVVQLYLNEQPVATLAPSMK